MRIGLPCLLALVLGSPAMSLVAAEQPAAAAFKDDREKVAYAIGFYFGTQVTNVIKRNGFEVDPDVILTAIRDVLAGHDVKMTDQEAQTALREYQVRHQREMLERNTRTGAAFLAENKAKPGVRSQSVIMPDGTTNEFLYKVITEGSGETPKSNELARVNYRGTLINGTEFENSAQEGTGPVSLSINGGLRGVCEALKRMKVGSKWEIYVPPSLAYGDRGVGNIEPGSTLIFEMELVGTEAAPPPPPPPSNRPLTSDIIRVPSAEEMKSGQKIQVIKADEAEKAAAAQNSQSKTNKKN